MSAPRIPRWTDGSKRQGRDGDVPQPLEPGKAIAASLASGLVVLVVILAVAGYCLLTSAPL